MAEDVNVFEAELITLEFDDGTNQECEILGIFPVEDSTYIALAPAEGESDDVYLYEYKELDDDSFELKDIEEDDLFDKVVDAFEKIMEEEEAEEE